MKVVVFDIDDTITYETEFLKQHAPKFLKDKYDIDIVIKNENGYNLEEIYDLNNILVKTGLNEEEAKYKSKKITNDFWNSNFIKYNLKKVRPGVKDLIHQLKKDGYDIHFVSLRGKKTKENDTKLNEFVRLKIVPLITKILLFSNGIKYDKLTLVKNEEEKLDYIGLSPKEKNEFIMYWLPILEKNGKNIVRFSFTEEVQEKNEKPE